jgi:prevent-host-death family protein
MMTMAAGEFKTHCLKLMDLAHDKHETIIITKRGIPVAKLVPYDDVKEDKNIFSYGCMAGTGEIIGDIIDFDTSHLWSALNGEEDDLC